MNGKYLIDLGERLIRTYVQTYLGLWIASGLGVEFVSDFSSADKALVSCLPAALSALMSIAAAGVGSPNTAALLPAAEDTPLPD